MQSAENRAERDDRTKAVQLQATLAGMSDAVMMVDREYRLVAWNDKFPDFTGVPREILRPGLPMEEILRAQALAGEFGKVDVEAEVSRRMSLLHSGVSLGTMERKRPDGRIVEIRRNEIPGGGFVTLYSDITARRAAEEASRRAEALAAVGRLTAGMAHDFNNLIATMSANAEMIQTGAKPGSDQWRRAEMILLAADRGRELLSQLLAFARKQPITPQPTRLNDSINEIRGLIQAIVGSQTRTTFDYEADLWLTKVDPIQIGQAVINLAANARDAMQQGGLLTITTRNVRIDCDDVHEELRCGDFVCLAVSDTGSGMSGDVLQRAFEPFFTTKPVGRGSGLGLSQVYGAARQCGGTVRIYSELGKGTRVEVLLPRSEQAPASEWSGRPGKEGADMVAKTPSVEVRAANASAIGMSD
ncbi:MAG: PAS-domain containing protein [Acidisphaera sp.]|nr:PAS-domain containing protein [Acidisphaera sp.]